MLETTFRAGSDTFIVLNTPHYKELSLDDLQELDGFFSEDAINIAKGKILDGQSSIYLVTYDGYVDYVRGGTKKEILDVYLQSVEDGECYDIDATEIENGDFFKGFHC